MTVLALVMLAVVTTVPHAAAAGQIDGASVVTTPFDRFRGILYVKYTGRFLRPASGSDYNVPFEIIAPADPHQSNGRVLVEPFHYGVGAVVRDVDLTPAFLFQRRFSHAAICRSAPRAEALPDHPCSGLHIDPGVDNLEIIVDFVRALREDPVARTLVGPITRLYSTGESNSSFPLHVLLHTPRGHNLFDLSFLLYTGWELPILAAIGGLDFVLPPDLPAAHQPVEGAGRVIVLVSESDVIHSFFNAAKLRDANPEHPTYRSYEIAGSPHVLLPPGTKPLDPNVVLPPGPQPLDRRPVARALFVAGDHWVVHGIAPPPSAFLEEAPPGTIDPVDPVPGPVVLARDANLNALGGIRLPDVAIGRGQFIAQDLTVAPSALFGNFIDLQCEPLPDGSTRFPSHGAYVRQYIRASLQLVYDRFLLWPDALRMIIEAAQSEVGKTGVCD
jgi:hypothetical protein